MSEGQQPNVDKEAIQSTISHLRMLWSDTRPDNVIDLSQDERAQELLRQIDPEGKFPLLPFRLVDPVGEDQRPEKTPALNALNDLLSMTAMTKGCRAAHLSAASTAYNFSTPVDELLKDRGLTFSDDDPGVYDPDNCHEHERKCLGFEFELALSSLLPELRGENLQRAIAWESEFRERYNDESFKELAQELGSTL